jgi:hypothetical protein
MRSGILGSISVMDGREQAEVELDYRILEKIKAARLSSDTL